MEGGERGRNKIIAPLTEIYVAPSFLGGGFYPAPHISERNSDSGTPLIRTP